MRRRNPKFELSLLIGASVLAALLVFATVGGLPVDVEASFSPSIVRIPGR